MTRPSWPRWTVICGAGEAIGMAAAAGTAVALSRTVGEPDDWPRGLTVWLGSIAGGAVEGIAVAGFQYRLLHRWLPRLPAGPWYAATVGVALTGWALGMAPSALLTWRLADDPASESATFDPSWLLMAAAGLALGLVLGAVFGAAQAAVLRRHVAASRRWVWANAAGWSLAMAVIMVGAGTPGRDWPVAAVVATGALTGVLAGLAIGAVTGLFLPSLDDDAPLGRGRVNRTVLRLLRSPAHGLLSGAIADLRYQGRRSGRWYALPVQYAPDGERLVVYPARPARKRWWRNFAEPSAVVIGRRGRVDAAVAVWLGPADPRYPAVVAAYRARWPRVRIGADDPVVVITPDRDRLAARVGGVDVAQPADPHVHPG